ncbi:phage portal protein [Nocardioides jejuensis]|uniref:phage portal protein n=1 Tax=Nocardioides jejuensis TaxID=2502782 RepID=UPI0014055AFE|nr:phage portal protein [Nocardioides jejuensis]
MTREQALRNSAVWACQHLRADLTSLMPVDVFRRVGGVQIEQNKPPVIVAPGGDDCRWMEWSYSTTVDLDSSGNTVGVIVERDGAGLPKVIELANIDEVSFIGKGSKIHKVRIGRTEYDRYDIWHEKQFTRAGLPVGLSPIAHAAWSIAGYLSAQEFAQDWFSNSTVPGGHLKNINKELNKGEALVVKENFKASIQSGDVWVSGNDWEYKMLSAKAADSAFIEMMDASLSDICRYLNVPGNMIDVPTKGSSVTYANLTQDNLRLLTLNMGGSLRRREEAISHGLLPNPRYIKFNRGVLLEMDIAARYSAHKSAIDARWKVPSEVREDENLPPLTPEQLAEFAVFSKAPSPSTVNVVTPKEGQE